MKSLLSLPPNLVGCFHDITGLSTQDCFCTNDPVGRKLGSGGGSAWLLIDDFLHQPGVVHSYKGFREWLSSEKRLLIHAGGQSRRLPAYAPSGKILTPIPVFRWERGQRLSQDLLTLQLPFYKQVLGSTPSSLRTMIVSGDVYIRTTQPLGPIPEADVVCFGLWLGPDVAKDHGVFVASRKQPSVMECMLQKPSVQTLGELQKRHFYLTDIGVWLLSDRAVEVLMRKCVDFDKIEKGKHPSDAISEYDLYGAFGCCLGTNPTIEDTEVRELTVAIVPLPGGEFYHFGTSHELLSSTLTIQSLVNDQREIMHHSQKPVQSVFVQNALTHIKFTDKNENVWVENSCIGEKWTLENNHIITGVPVNNWTIHLKANQCIDVVPLGETDWVVRPYGYFDKFEGKKQEEECFPVAHHLDEIELFLHYMLGDDESEEARERYEKATKLSAEMISAQADLRRLVKQRHQFRTKNWAALASNYAHSVFYQVDLDDAAHTFASDGIPLPKPIAVDEPLMTRIHDAMFRSEVLRLEGLDGKEEEKRAFELLREGIIENDPLKVSPRLNVCLDQIVWSRSPVRIDISGGWTDTPPFCLMEGGNVINLGIELNGQPPLQTYIKPCVEKHIVLKSIDLGATEEITTYKQLADFSHVGSPFSIPKAALVLAGFHPDFCTEQYATLTDQLDVFGCGLELTMLSAIPAGSGLGTSSILASTVLAAISDFCGLAWDKNTIGNRTLVLEQMLTTGGGWQDQFGGILQGVKLLQTGKGFDQNPIVRWLPDDLYTKPEYAACHLLYYTGITRTAKKILAEIVRGMFLNQHEEILKLRQMKAHTQEMFDAIQREDFQSMGLLLRENWLQNQALDRGTNPDAVKHIADKIDDLCLGYKLPGAGGGGYLYMVAKDPEAAARITSILNAHRPNANARFVQMTLSKHGLQVSRS